MIRLQQTRKALGSQATITIVAAKPHQILSKLWAKIDDFEAQFSRFRPDSELSQINAKPGSSVTISPKMHDILAVSQHMQQKTDGLYNPLILPALQRAGYVGSWPHPKQFVTATDYRGRQSAPRFKLTKDKILMPKDSALDLGGIGKGYLLDQLANWLLVHTVTNFWISLGGDIITHGFNLDDRPWEVGIQSADTSGILKTIINSDGSLLAICTSGTTKRGGEAWHHIIDPRTDKPAKTTIATTTVCGASAMHSEIAAKTLIITDGQQAEQMLRTLACQKAIVQRTIDNRVISEAFYV